MMMPPSDSASCRGSESYWGPKLATRSMSNFGHLVYNLVISWEDVVGELNFHYWSEAI